jgi:hypothetical protein
MRHLNRYLEVIKVPIEVGDTVLGGRFKNKKTVVKKIAKNDKGDITINGKPLLKYRILKESYERLKEDIEWILAILTDQGFSFKLQQESDNLYYLRVWKPIQSGSQIYSYSTCRVFSYSEVEGDLIRLFSLEDYRTKIKYITSISKIHSSNHSVERILIKPESFFNSTTGLGKINSITIGFQI